MAPPLSTSTTLKRIHREIADLKKEDLGTIGLAPSDDNLFKWTATIPGPEGSCYEGGVFSADINLGHDYPFSAPKVTFKTRIYHMNINERGNICIDILKSNWSPALSLFKVVLSLSSLLTDPNPKDPLVPSIATEYVRNRTQHDRTARNWTELYARPPAPNGSAKGKGKAKTPELPASTSASTRPSSSSAAGNTERHAITIVDDSDDDVLGGTRRSRAGAKRKRGQTTSGGASDVLTIDDDEPTSRPTRKRKSGGSSSDASPGVRVDGDVIVIED
ncbi:uncharacterized protein FIBRA_08802 [Fibroporia radiculosa]|uniref:E2 ubiquitin-conjugating enzyme n=1 Tax=Fibroporia radiculosa TaxID=599839 RepID=J4H5D1_9APHY|nr:uncharacterized protein FIBRA_08802 [Fibroporia radiculosa]CCM06529.1 predicted protein [Fibroporia radiculosa]